LVHRESSFSASQTTAEASPKADSGTRGSVRRRSGFVHVGQCLPTSKLDPDEKLAPRQLSQNPVAGLPQNFVHDKGRYHSLIANLLNFRIIVKIGDRDDHLVFDQGFGSVNL
jgi:hypothetical protein